jgi:transcriptional regulator with XRE-family HTH domain
MRKQFTQEELARSAGIPALKLPHIEKGEVNVSLSTMVHLAKALGTEVVHLISSKPGRGISLLDAEHERQNDAAIEDFLRRLGERIRKVREGEGISRATVSVLCGLEQAYLGEIERGEIDPTAGELHRVSRVLNVTVADLIRGIA